MPASGVEPPVSRSTLAHAGDATADHGDRALDRCARDRELAGRRRESEVVPVDRRRRVQLGAGDEDPIGQEIWESRLTVRPAAHDEPGDEVEVGARETWASGFYNGVTVWQGDRQVARYDLLSTFGAPVGFSANGKTIYLGMRDVDVATGAVSAAPLPDVMAWLTSKGYPAPPTLSFTLARRSDDGKIVVAAGSGTTRDLRLGLQKAKTGNNDWLIAFDGATHQPVAVLSTAKDLGEVTDIAISDRFVATCGWGPPKVFARDALDKSFELDGALRDPFRVVWSADGNLLAVADTNRKLAIWHTGTWTVPAASWDLPENGIAAAFDPARPLFAVGGNDGHVRIYKVDDASLAAPNVVVDQEVGGQVAAVAWSPDGADLLVAAMMPQGKIFRFAVKVSP